MGELVTRPYYKPVERVIRVQNSCEELRSLRFLLVFTVLVLSFFSGAACGLSWAATTGNLEPLSTYLVYRIAYEIEVVVVYPVPVEFAVGGEGNRALGFGDGL
ncbi:MAG: hypothetical protein R3B51_11620 [Thermodesulfobacteriota bacterium]